MVEYRGSDGYVLTALSEEGKSGASLQASCQLQEGAGHSGNLAMTGFLGEKRVSANVTTVGDQLHVFTSVSKKE